MRKVLQSLALLCSSQLWSTVQPPLSNMLTHTHTQTHRQVTMCTRSFINNYHTSCKLHCTCTNYPHWCRHWSVKTGAANSEKCLIRGQNCRASRLQQHIEKHAFISHFVSFFHQPSQTTNNTHTAAVPPTLSLSAAQQRCWVTESR